MFQTKISIYIFYCHIRIIEAFKLFFFLLILGIIESFKIYSSSSHASVSEVEVPKISQDPGIPFIFRWKQEVFKHCTQIITLCVHYVAFGNYSGLNLAGFLNAFYPSKDLSVKLRRDKPKSGKFSKLQQNIY